MVSIRDIIEKNSETFFDHRLNERQSIVARILGQVAVALLLAILFFRGISPFLGGVITIQAILIGFSFSVMFFLVSSGGSGSPRGLDESVSIEDALRRDQAIKVAGEIFSNLAYFNLVCLFCLATALVLMLPPLSASSWWVNIVPPKPIFLSELFHWSGYLVWISCVWLFYFLVIESAFTFLRITGRINFLFSEKIRP